MKACELAAQECIPCKGGVPPLTGEKLQSLHRAVNNGWQLVGEHHLEKEYKFPDFREAGLRAQRDSLTVLTNSAVLPLARGVKVFAPDLASLGGYAEICERGVRHRRLQGRAVRREFRGRRRTRSAASGACRACCVACR